ncbi:hypothetical protein [Streptosporangium sandarakinum]|uniref:hypothetical protein n=1 Tax=Streptosporangium sandarakinum TaxID=1260955 RepID=UPI0033A70050
MLCDAGAGRKSRTSTDNGQDSDGTPTALPVTNIVTGKAVAGCQADVIDGDLTIRMRHGHHLHTDVLGSPSAR